MKRFLFILSLIGVFAVGASAKDLKADLVFSGNRTWSGTLQGREGDMVVFWRNGKTRAVPLGISTIEQIRFKVSFDIEELQELLDNHQYDAVIRIIQKTLRPFKLYSDIPSNLSPYNFKLMQVYYWNGDFDKSLELSEVIVNDNKNESFQQDATIFRVLAFIGSGQMDEAQQIMDKLSSQPNAQQSPALLYAQAKMLALRGENMDALEMAAKVVAFHSQDPDWMAPAELLCAEMYAELGYYDSAQEVIRQIGILHKGTAEFEKANKLKLSVDKMRAEATLKKFKNEYEEE